MSQYKYRVEYGPGDEPSIAHVTAGEAMLQQIDGNGTRKLSLFPVGDDNDPVFEMAVGPDHVLGYTREEAE